MNTSKNLILGGFFTMILLSNCLTDKKNDIDSIIEKTESDIQKLNVGKTEDILKKDNFKSEFAGSYTIEIRGLSSAHDVEVYALNENGGASWLWIQNDGNGGANVQDRKTGTWIATENRITVDIQGNTGVISETYELKNNVLTNIQFPKRYLKRTE